MIQICEAEIVLELCPTSNLLTKALPAEDALRDTFRAFSEHGVPFTIATDGLEMMRTHLRDEFELLLRIGALDEEQLGEAEPARVRGEFRSRRLSLIESASAAGGSRLIRGRRPPSIVLLLPTRWRPGKRCSLVGAEAVEDDGEVASAELLRALWVGRPDRGHELPNEREVVDCQIVAHGAPNPVEQRFHELVRALGEREHLLGWGERAGERECQRARVGVDDPGHVVDEDGPRIAVVGQRRLGFGDEAGEALVAERAQELLLAGVARIDGADPDAGVFRDGADRRVRMS